MGPGFLELRWIAAQERVLNLLDRLAGRLRPARIAPNLLTGIRGERAALFELRRRGYTVVETRWSSPKARGDIDLVAWQGKTLCFLEVKSRTARDITPAASAVDDRKRRVLRTLARLYIATFPAAERRSIPLRFDVVSVYLLPELTEIEVVPDAFPLQSPDR
jgi:putative endonuclease